jgi:lipoate---protein ligase
MKFEKIRLLETGFNSGPWNMAIDEVLLMNFPDHDTIAAEDAPILRLYGWRPSTVSIGYFQSMAEEVDVNRCKQLGIDVVRRMTGGGAVLHESELTYSFIAGRYPANIMESYRLICEPVVMGLNKLGFCAKYSPLNDITVNNKKVSGNAQTRKKNKLLQHGTILLNVDFDKMFSVLKVPSEKIRDKLIKDVKARVMGIDKTFEQVAHSVTESFGQSFGAKIVRDEITRREKEHTEKLLFEKYSSHEWNYKR